jgi:hypothetical protein
MDGQRLARLALVADAAYCGLAALCLLAFASPLSGALGVPISVLVAAAVGTIAWAIGLRLMAGRQTLRPWLVGVLAANILAVVVITLLAATRSPDAYSLLLAAVALEVAAFAVVQGVALRRRPH